MSNSLPPTPHSSSSTNTRQQRIGILGLGAIGTLMAWHWRQHTVVALQRSDSTTQSSQRQLTLLNGEHTRFTLPSWQDTELDWLVITTKAAQTLTALAPWQPQLHRVKRLLLLQNGMGQQQEVEQWLADQQLDCEVWQGISTEGAFRSSPEHVVYAGSGHTVIGTAHGGPTEQVLLPPQLQTVSDIQQRQREKLAINAVINPLTGLLRCRNGELVSNLHYRQQLIELATEVQSLYRHLGWTLATNLVDRALQVAEATGHNKSSTLQDILADRPTELAYICGYLLNLAEPSNWPLPITQRVYRALQQQRE